VSLRKCLEAHQSATTMDVKKGGVGA